MKVLELKIFQSGNKKHNCIFNKPRFFLFSLFAKSIFQMVLEENCEIFYQMLHYSNELNNLIVCHHKFSFNVTMTLFLFKGTG